MDEVNKEILYQFNMKIPKSCYLKPTYGEGSRKYAKINKILLYLIAIELLIGYVVIEGRFRLYSGVSGGAFLLILLYSDIVTPGKKAKIYNKYVAAGEDCFIYTFYEDYVNAKNVSVEMNLQYNSAEIYAETNDIIMITFPVGNWIAVDKSKCTQEQLQFVRNIVPLDKKENDIKKSARKYMCTALISFIQFLVLGACIFVLGFNPSRTKNENHAYLTYTELQNTSYSSFVDCVKARTIKDVLIIDDRYVEYTFIGRGYDERYFTECDNIDELITILDSNYTNYKYEED
ncbi:MAG: hypothetical protein ACI4EF_06735 [Coprococcus sp.]